MDPEEARKKAIIGLMESIEHKKITAMLAYSAAVIALKGPGQI